MDFVYDKEAIGCINLFENLAKIKVKDCYKSEKDMVFIVDSVYMSRSIGKNGSNVKKLSHLLRKSIRIIEFSSDVLKFISNIISPVDGKVYKESEGVVAIKLSNSKDKGIVIGRDKKNITMMQAIVSRYFDIKVKVV